MKNIGVLLLLLLASCGDISSVNYEVEAKKLYALSSNLRYFKDIKDKKEEISHYKETFCPNIEPRFIKALMLDDILSEGGENRLDGFIKDNPLIINEKEYPLRLASVIRLKKINPKTFSTLHESIRSMTDIQELEKILSKAPSVSDKKEMNEEKMKLLSVFGCLIPTYYLGLIGEDNELDDLSRTILIEYFVQANADLNMEAIRIKNQLEKQGLLN